MSAVLEIMNDWKENYKEIRESLLAKNGQNPKIDDETKRNIIKVKNILLKAIVYCSSEEERQELKSCFYNFLDTCLLNNSYCDDGHSYMVIGEFFVINYPRNFITISKFFRTPILDNKGNNKLSSSISSIIEEWCNRYDDLELKLLNLKINTVKNLNESPVNILNKDLDERLKKEIDEIENFLLNAMETANDDISRETIKIFFRGLVENFIFRWILGISSYIYEKDKGIFVKMKEFFEIQ